MCREGSTYKTRSRFFVKDEPPAGTEYGYVIICDITNATSLKTTCVHCLCVDNISDCFYKSDDNRNTHVIAFMFKEVDE